MSRYYSIYARLSSALVSWLGAQYMQFYFNSHLARACALIVSNKFSLSLSAGAATLGSRHALHPHKRSAYNCCSADMGLAGRGCVRGWPNRIMFILMTCWWYECVTIELGHQSPVLVYGIGTHTNSEPRTTPVRGTRRFIVLTDLQSSS